MNVPGAFFTLCSKFREVVFVAGVEVSLTLREKPLLRIDWLKESAVLAPLVADGQGAQALQFS